jgi:hypothetical protein
MQRTRATSATRSPCLPSCSGSQGVMSHDRAAQHSDLHVHGCALSAQVGHRGSQALHATRPGDLGRPLLRCVLGRLNSLCGGGQRGCGSRDALLCALHAGDEVSQLGSQFAVICGSSGDLTGA